MKTLTLTTPGSWKLTEETPAGSPPAGHALVKVHRVGICGTDIHAFRGKQPFFTYPRVLGHELGVEVLELGEGETVLKPGDRCAVEPYLNCRRCHACRKGKGNCCTELRVLGVHADGGMREFLHVPFEKLHRSRHLDFEQLALVETLGIGAHAVARTQVTPGENILVVGAGPIGLSVIPFVKAQGATVGVMDISPARLAFAKSAMGANHLVKASAAEPVSAIREAFNGELPDAVIDATGNPASMAAAFNYPAHGGRLTFVGLFQGEVTFNDPQFHRRELTLNASRNALPGDFSRILSLIEKGAVDTRPWITHRCSLSELPGVFDSWLQPDSGLLKGMVSV